MASASVAALTAFVLALQTAPLSAAVQTANDAAAGNGFSNAGTLRVLANGGWQGNLTVGGTQTITNTGTRELTTSHGNQSSDITITASINNQGGTVSLIKQGNTNWTPSTFPLAGATYTNSGTWTVPQYRGMTISGANATFTQSAGVLTNVGGITFSGGKHFLPFFYLFWCFICL